MPTKLGCPTCGTQEKFSFSYAESVRDGPFVRHIEYYRCHKCDSVFDVTNLRTHEILPGVAPVKQNTSLSKS